MLTIFYDYLLIFKLFLGSLFNWFLFILTQLYSETKNNITYKIVLMKTQIVSINLI